MGGRFANIGVYSVVSPKVEVQILKAEWVVSLREWVGSFLLQEVKRKYRILLQNPNISM